MLPYQLREHSHDILLFFGYFDLPTFLPTSPDPILYYISLFSKIRRSLTYLSTLKYDVICECSL